MEPNASRTLKQIDVSKINASTKSTESAILQSPESSDAPAIKLVTTLDGVDFIREYHGVEDSDYFLPSDIGEQDRLELQHYLLRHLFKGDITREDIMELAKQPGCKIFDVGCANGYWLDSISQTYPLAELHGVDLAPSVIENATKRFPNISFTTGNIVTGLPYEDNTFDFVHQRLLILGLPGEQYPAAIRELMRVTKPGGWIELVETDVVNYRTGPVTNRLLDAIKAVMAPRKLDFLAGTNLVPYVLLAAKNTKLRAAKLQKRTVSLPFNWGGPIGEMATNNAKQLYSGMEDFLHKLLGVEREEYRELVVKMTEEAKVLKTFANTYGVSFQVQKLK